MRVRMCQNQAALAQGGGAVEELGADLVAVVNGVVEALLEVALAEVLVDRDQVGQVLRGVVGDRRRGVGGLDGGDVEDVENEHRVVGHDRAAGFRDQVRVGDADLVADLHDGLDDVGAIFEDRVVAGGLEVGVGAVVVDRHDAHRRAFLDQVAVHPGDLGRALADRGDVRDLAALVVVEHAQAAEVAGFLQMVDHSDDLGRAEAEDRLVAGAFRPVAGAAGREADADAEVRQHAELARALEHEVELAGHFKHQHHPESHLLGVEGEVDELLVLVAVADDVGLGVVHVSQRGDQLGLGAGLETVVVLLAELRDLLDDLALLVDLDRIDAAVFALVALFLDGLGEGLVDLGDAMAEGVLQADDEGGLEAHAFGLLDHVHEPDVTVIGQRLHLHEPPGIHGEVVGAPALETIVFFGLRGRPSGCGFGLQMRGRLRVGG